MLGVPQRSLVEEVVIFLQEKNISNLQGVFLSQHPVRHYLPTYTSKMSNFHHTAEGPSIHVHEGRFLRCRIAREDGEYVDAEMDLNCCIGNDNGRFQWGGQSKSALHT